MLGVVVRVVVVAMMDQALPGFGPGDRSEGFVVAVALYVVVVVVVVLKFIVVMAVIVFVLLTRQGSACG